MKKQTKHEKIIALYKEGMKPMDISRKLKCGPSTVYNAITKYKKTLGKVVFVQKNPIDDIKFMMQTGCVTYRPGTEPVKQEKTFLQKVKEFMGL